MKRPLFVTVIIALVVLHAVVIGAAIYAVAYVTFRDPRQDVRLSAFVPRASDEASDWGHAFQGVRDETATLCGPPIGCMEGYRGDRLTLLRFDSKDRARAHAASLGNDGYQSDWIVADFSRGPLDEYYRRIVRDDLDKIGQPSKD